MIVKINGNGMGAYLLANECISRGYNVYIENPIKKYDNPIIMLKKDLEEYGLDYKNFGKHYMNKSMFIIDDYKMNFEDNENPFCYFNSDNLIDKVNKSLIECKEYDHVINTKGLKVKKNVCCYVYACEVKNLNYIENTDTSTFLAWYANKNDYIIIDNKKYHISFELEPNIDGSAIILTYIYTIGKVKITREQLEKAFIESSLFKKIETNKIEVNYITFNIIKSGDSYPIFNKKRFGEASGMITPSCWVFRSLLKNVKTYVDFLEGRKQKENKDAKYLFNIYLSVMKLIAFNNEKMNFFIFPMILKDLNYNYNLSWINIALAENISSKVMSRAIIRNLLKHFFRIAFYLRLSVVLKTLDNEKEVINGVSYKSNRKLKNGFQYYKTIK